MYSKDKEIIKYYHERTKHKPYKYARGPEYLDWSNEPKPFRRYSNSEKIKLPFSNPNESPSFYQSLFQFQMITPAQFNMESISNLFLFSLGISAWKEYRGVRWAVRCNPSAGNLHPTEAYLIAPPHLLNNEEATLYHYVADEHILEVRAIDHNSNWEKFYKGKTTGKFIIIGLTSVIWRMAWKYGERALRYCLLDIGHAISAITYSARAMGWQTTALSKINWEQQATILGLTRKEFNDVEKETPQVLLLIHPHNSNPEKNFNLDYSSTLFTSWYGVPDRLSPEPVDWEIIDDTVQALSKFSSKFSTEFLDYEKRIETINESTVPLDHIPHSPPSYTLFRQRRSAHELDPKTFLQLEKFESLLQNLKFVKTNIIKRALGINLPTLITIFVHSIDKLESGIYIFPLEESAVSESLKNELLPIKMSNGEVVYLYKKGNFRKFANYILCGQDVGGNSIALFGIFANLQNIIDKYTEFAYALLHWEAGFLIHHLYLEAEILNLQGTGIGCFFDDEFIIKPTQSKESGEIVPIYYYALGKPIPDLRLKTSPPYPIS